MASWPCGQHPRSKPEGHRRRERAARRGAWATGCDCGAGALPRRRRALNTACQAGGVPGDLLSPSGPRPRQRADARAPRSPSRLGPGGSAAIQRRVSSVIPTAIAAQPRIGPGQRDEAPCASGTKPRHTSPRRVSDRARSRPPKSTIPGVRGSIAPASGDTSISVSPVKGPPCGTRRAHVASRVDRRHVPLARANPQCRSVTARRRIAAERLALTSAARTSGPTPPLTSPLELPAGRPRRLRLLSRPRKSRPLRRPGPNT